MGKHKKMSEHQKRAIEMSSLMILQNHKCGICFKPFDSQKNNQKHLDHCHISGKWRGLLCTKCNVTLGMVDENIDRLQMCIQYLTWWKEEHSKNIEKDYDKELSRLLELEKKTDDTNDTK